MTLCKNYSLPLTPLQEGILSEMRRKDAPGLYNNQVIIALREIVDAVGFEKALESTVARYPALRASFSESTASMHISQESLKELLYVDLSHLAVADQEKQAAKLIRADKSRGFDLGSPSLLRFRLIKFGMTDYRLIITYHHLLFGGDCALSIVQDLFYFYDTTQGRKLTGIAPLDSFEQCMTAISQFDKRAAEKHWTSYLKDYSQTASLPKRLEKTKIGSSRYQSVSFPLLQEGMFLQLRQYCRANHITYNLFFRMSWGVLLRYYCDSEFVVFGATRQFPRKCIGNQAGLFFNTLPVIFKTTSQTTVREVIDELRSQYKRAAEHIFMPLSAIKQLTSLPVTSALFDSIIDFKAYDPDYFMSHHYPFWGSRSIQFEFSTEIPFFLEISGIDQNFQGRITYQTQYFQSPFMRQVVGHYQQVVNRLIDFSPDCCVRDFSFLSVAEENKLLSRWNNTAYASSLCQKGAYSLFEEQVRQHPKKLALICGDQSLSYAALHQEVTALASSWQEKYAIRSQDRVLICLPRNIQFVVAVLAAQRLRVTYVPVDPQTPKKRLQIIKRDCRPTLIISSEEERGFNQHLLSKRQSDRVDLYQHHVYIRYTSGSTGEPKGIVIKQTALINLLLSMKDKLEFSSQETLLAVTNFSFDISELEILLPLISGAKCIIATDDQVKYMPAITNLIRREKITCMQATPSYWQALLAIGFIPRDNMKLLCGGERMPTSIAKDLLLNARSQFWQVYGPTETTIWSTIYRVKQSDLESTHIPIGKPLYNTQVYVLNTWQQLAPVGTTGELYIGGAGLAEGYLNRPELTEKVFVSGIFEDRLYKTGDRVRWMPNGNLQYIGRIDEQLKLHGYRIELGEINAVLRWFKGIKHAVVVLSDKLKAPTLVAYYVADRSVDKESMESHITSYLPAYMCPSHYVRIAKMPMTVQGKIDQKALSALEISVDVEAGYRPKQSELIRYLWSAALGIPIAQISWDSHFFMLGGNSVTATLVIAQLNSHLNKQIPVNALFLNPTASEFYRYLLHKDLLKEKENTSIQAAPAREYYSLSFAQQRLWFMQQMAYESAAYNMFVAFQLDGELDVPKFQAVWQTMVVQHAVLRTRYIDQHGKIRQVIDPVNRQVLSIVNAIHMGEQEQNQYSHQFAQKTFDLSKDWPLRVSLLSTEKNEYLLLISLHHIAADGWSIALLAKQLGSLYASVDEDKAVPSLQYVDFAYWQTQTQHALLEEQLPYWVQQLRQLPLLLLPFDYPRSESTDYRGERLAFSVDSEITRGLKALSLHHGCTLFTVLLSAFSVLLSKYSGQEDFAVGTAVSGRHHPQVTQMIGLFVNLLVLRQDLSGEPIFTEVLKRTKRTLLDAFAHQDIPFESVVEACDVPRQLNYHPLCQVLFIMQDLPWDPVLGLGGVSVKRILGDNDGLLMADYESAKFDLSFYLKEVNGGLEGLVEFSSQLFSTKTIQTWIAYYQSLLAELVAQPEQQISGYLAAPFKGALTNLPTHTYSNVVSWFETQVSRFPQRIAVQDGNTQLTYSELDQRANKLASHLVRQSDQTQFIGICIGRCVEVLISILAVLKTGAAYVPIDPAYPLTRIQYLLEDAGIKVLLTRSTDISAKLMDVLRSCTIDQIFVDEMLRADEPAPIRRIWGKSIQQSNIAYMLYTSGSTGLPKGVLIPHENIAKLFYSTERLYEFNQKDVWTLLHSCSFDFSVWEIWGALLYGGKLIIVPETYLKEPEAKAGQMSRPV